MRTLLHGRDRLAYVGQKVRKARQLVETRLWRIIVLWHRGGGWLPHILRDVTQANRNARRDYIPQAYGGRVTLFRVIQRGQRLSDPTLGWEALATGGLEIHDVPGTHGNMVEEPHVRTLAEKLARCLEEAWTRPRESPGATVTDGNKAA